MSGANPIHKDMAKHLWDALRKEGRQVLGRLDKWADDLRLLKEHDKQDYIPVLEWFAKHCSTKDQESFGLPAIASARQFRSCYGWIRGKSVTAKKKQAIEDNVW